MAKPIKNTPVLWGNDARDFISKMSNVISQREKNIERDRIDNSLSELRNLIKKLNIR